MGKEAKRRGVVICGAYGLDNAGDDAVLTALVSALRRIDADIPITVMARKPKKTAERFGVAAIHPLNPLGWIHALRRAALFLSGGGSLLQDVTSRRSLHYYLAAIRLAKACGCAVQMIGCGIGPLRYARSRARTAEVLNACVDVITLRDGESRKLLRELGVTKPRILLAADPVFSLKPPKGEREQRLGIALRLWPGFDEKVPAIAAAVRYTYETYHLAPVFFCLGSGDREAAAAVCAELSGIPRQLGVDVRRLGRMSLVLSMRLHGLTFALAGGAPGGGISYDPKVESFCREAGLPVLSLEALDAEGLCRLIDEAARLDADKLHAAASELRQRERVNMNAAAELLNAE